MRKLITIVTRKGRITTNRYKSRNEALAAIQPEGLFSVTVRPMPDWMKGQAL